MELNAIQNFEFIDFKHEMCSLNITHHHTIRREPGVTYVDKWAKDQLEHLQPELYRQFIPGWSRSYYDLSKHMEAIMNYAVPDIPYSNINSDLYKRCIHTLRTGFRSLPKAEAFDVLTELDRVPYKSSTSAGFDYDGAKGPLGGENHKRAIRRARATVGFVKDNGVQALIHTIKTMVPDVGYTRTQLTDLTEKMKVRSVWGRAFHYILLEGLTAAPLIKLFQENKTFYHIGRDPLDSVPITLSEAAASGKWLYAIDWRQFDATVSRFEINAAFNLVKELINFPNDETLISFEICRQLFIHKKIAAPDGQTYWVHKGIPSGSYFTSVIGSIVNRLRIEYLWRTILGRGPNFCCTQGDDSISSDNEFIPPERFAEVANRIGWILNPDKTEYSTIPGEVTFLGRTSIGGMNARNIKRCLRLLVYPEFPVESGRISAYRAQSIAEDAGGVSDILNSISRRLAARYGIASEDEVPVYFKRYVM